jgi:hypothetical protein
MKWSVVEIRDAPEWTPTPSAARTNLRDSVATHLLIFVDFDAAFSLSWTKVIRYVFYA